MVDLAVLFGAEKSAAERDMNDAIDFEMKLAKVSISKINFSKRQTMKKQTFEILHRIR